MSADVSSPRHRLGAPPSMAGLLVAALLFGLSMTPSMVPREPELQGVLGGLVAGVGYLLWWLAARLLGWLGLLPGRVPSGAVRVGLGVAAALFALACVVQGASWQSSIHRTWALPPAGAWAPLRVAGIAMAVFVALLLVGRIFQLIALRWRRRSQRILPPRMAQAVGVAVAALAFAVVIEGLAARAILRTLDNGARLADAMIPPELAPPGSALRSGGPGSLLAWEDLGRWGRSFVGSGPATEEIAAFWNEPAEEPIRVYVGLSAAGTAEARARLAFDELLRAGGFEREVLVVAMPTGSGWLDPGSMDALEFVTRGDVATVAVQYSYLPSPVSVVADPTTGLAEAQALFDVVYRHWTTLPEDTRPRLYLHGLSLGAFLSQATVPLLDLFADPVDGALWSGSPFLSEFWRMVRVRRHPESPEWRPRFGNGSLIRTMNQDGGLERFDAPWGPIRFVFLQYGSDPIVFFDWSLAWSRPAWLAGDRAPDVSPQMRWIPLVTLFQVGLDMALAVGVPGYGHDYSAAHYVEAWGTALAPPSWSEEASRRLARYLRDRTRAGGVGAESLD